MKEPTLATAGTSIDEAAIIGTALAMTPDGRAAYIAGLYQLADLCDSGEFEGKTLHLTVDVGEIDEAKAVQYTHMIRTTGLAYTLRTMSRRNQHERPRVRFRGSRSRERHSARSSKSGRGSPDSELPPEHPAAYWRRLEIIAAEIQAWFRRQAGVVA